MPELEKDPLLTKDELVPKTSFKLGDDEMFPQIDGENDETQDGIAERILKKMKENKEAE
jgi:hypothetical protein